MLTRSRSPVSTFFSIDGLGTAKACGLRLTTTAEERSQLQCVEGKMTLPSEEPQRVELDFGAPGAGKTAGKHPGKKKKRK